MQIHERIKNERLKANLTEEEMAARLGIKRSTYQYWEKKTPDFEKIKLVANALGLHENYFFTYNDENEESYSSKNSADLPESKAGKYGTGFISIKTASGQTLEIQPETENEIKILNALLQERERIIIQIEKENEKLTRIIESGLIEIKASLNKANDGLNSIEKWQWAEHKVMLQEIAHLRKKPVDSLAEEAGILLSEGLPVRSLTGNEKGGNK